jgi:hypothetical protein
VKHEGRAFGAGLRLVHQGIYRTRFHTLVSRC